VVEAEAVVFTIQQDYLADQVAVVAVEAHLQPAEFLAKVMLAVMEMLGVVAAEVLVE